MEMQPVPCLVGPTGSGKSDVGVAAARRNGGEIICCDAYTVYREMPILTAAPDVPEDVPHHLLGLVDPECSYNAAAFVRDCDGLVEAIHARGRRPWIVGGTALYLRCWLKGMGTTVPRDEAYRAELRIQAAAHGPLYLHAALQSVDPERASELHPNDVRRVVRALEIIKSTGDPASSQRMEWSGPDRVAAKVYGLRRPWEDLDDRIERRTAGMFKAGVLEEARALLKQPLSPEAGKVLGLTELRRLLAGEIDEAEAREVIVRRTKRFARKQMTFFNSFDGLVWVDIEPGEDAESIAARL